MRREPSPATLGALRATLDCHRLATAILQDRITDLAAVPCAVCGRPVAVATDAAHPAREYEGRIVCAVCDRAQRVAVALAWGLDRVEPPVETCMAEIELWVREGWVQSPPTPDRGAA